jgi:hypothetical protein
MPDLHVTVVIEALELVDEAVAPRRPWAPTPRLSLADYLRSRSGT